MTNREEIELAITTLRDELDELRDRISNYKEWYRNEDDDYFEQSYNDYLDDNYGYIDIEGISFYPSNILKEIDPVAYDTGLNDYIDGISVDDIPGYIDVLSDIDALEDKIEDLEFALSNIEE